MIICQRDDIAKDNGMHVPSGFFFINGTFYDDTRDPKAIRYSKNVLQFIEHKQGQGKSAVAALSRGEEKDRIERMASTGLDHKFKRATMEDVTFASLELKLGSGHPYVYCHQGCCEHRLAFHDLRAVHTDDRSLRSEYPRTIYHKFERRVKVRLTHKSTHTHSFSDFRVPPADSFHSSSKFFVLVFRLPPLPSLVHGMRVRRGKVHRVLGRQSTLLSLRHVRGLPPEPPPGHEGEGAVRRLPNVPLPDRGSQGDMREDDVYTRKNPLFFVWFCEFFCFFILQEGAWRWRSTAQDHAASMTLCTKKKRTARPNHLSRPPRWRLARSESVSFQGARLPRQAPPGALPPRPRPRPRVPRPLPRPRRFIFGPLSTSPPLPLAPPSFSLLRTNVFSSVPSAMLLGRYGRP